MCYAPCVDTAKTRRYNRSIRLWVVANLLPLDRDVPLSQRKPLMSVVTWPEVAVFANDRRSCVGARRWASERRERITSDACKALDCEAAIVSIKWVVDYGELSLRESLPPYISQSWSLILSLVALLEGGRCVQGLVAATGPNLHVQRLVAATNLWSLVLADSAATSPCVLRPPCRSRDTPRCSDPLVSPCCSPPPERFCTLSGCEEQSDWLLVTHWSPPLCVWPCS